MNRRTTRLMWIGSIGLVLAVAIGLSMYALRSGISFAMSPSELKAAEVPAGQRVRLFGLVEEGSVKRGDGLNVRFTLVDTDEAIEVSFNKILPDLFREGQGVVTLGRLSDDGTFVAEEVLAKHDETYMPPEAGEAVKAAQRAQATVVEP